MADIFLNCGSCGKELVVDEAGAGLRVDCPNCNAKITIPFPPPIRSSEFRVAQPSRTDRIKSATKTVAVVGVLLAVITVGVGLFMFICISASESFDWVGKKFQDWTTASPSPQPSANPQPKSTVPSQSWKTFGLKQDEIERLYGRPTRSYRNDHSELTSWIHTVGDMLVQVEYCEDQVCSVAYQKQGDGALSDEEIERILRANAEGAVWTKGEYERGPAWSRSDSLATAFYINKTLGMSKAAWVRICEMVEQRKRRESEEQAQIRRQQEQQQEEARLRRQQEEASR